MMQLYTVSVSETYENHFLVYAKTPIHAHEIISDKYGEGKIVLKNDDFVDFTIEVIE